jgi:hypothetical protein
MQGIYGKNAQYVFIHNLQCKKYKCPLDSSFYGIAKPKSGIAHKNKKELRQAPILWAYHNTRSNQYAA